MILTDMNVDRSLVDALVAETGQMTVSCRDACAQAQSVRDLLDVLDPKDSKHVFEIRVDDGYVWYSAHALNERGNKYLNPDGSIATLAVAVPIA